MNTIFRGRIGNPVAVRSISLVPLALFCGYVFVFYPAAGAGGVSPALFGLWPETSARRDAGRSDRDGSRSQEQD